tara:strand:+ start:129 stop:560 length:432 start_codon:yes stop_codon:yes gene_type:complete
MDNEYTSPLVWEIPTGVGADTSASMEDRVAHYLANHGNQEHPKLETVEMIIGCHDMLLDVGGQPSYLIVEEDGIDNTVEKLTQEVVDQSPSVFILETKECSNKLGTTCRATGRLIKTGSKAWFISHFGLVDFDYGVEIGLVVK